MKRVLWINPMGTTEFDQPLVDALQSETSAQLDVASLTRGPRNLDYEISMAAASVETLGVLRWAEKAGYDAAIIGCFYDPYLRAAREILTNMVVTAPAESALHIAATLGDSYSILVGSRKNIPEMHDNVFKYGNESKLASFRTLDIAVNDYQKDLEFTRGRIFREAELAANEDRADVIVLGCTAQFGIYKEIQQKLDVPVIDSAVAALQFAAMLSSIRADQGWRTSRASGYGAPPVEDLEWIPYVEPTNLIEGAR